MKFGYLAIIMTLSADMDYRRTDMYKERRKEHYNALGRLASGTSSGSSACDLFLD